LDYLDQSDDLRKALRICGFYSEGNSQFDDRLRALIDNRKPDKEKLFIAARV
jgi:hypothetical protein